MRTYVIMSTIKIKWGEKKNNHGRHTKQPKKQNNSTCQPFLPVSSSGTKGVKLSQHGSRNIDVT